MSDQALADGRAGPDHHVDHAFWQAGLQRDLGEAQGSKRCELRRLEDDGVAARERRAELPGSEHEREVPRHDEAHDTECLAESHVHAAGDRNRLAVMLVDGAGVEVEDIGDHAHLPARVGEWLAGVGGLQPRQLLAVLLHERRDAAQQASTIGGLHGAPRGKGSFGGGYCSISFGRARSIQVRYRLLGRRVDYVDGRGSRGHPRSNRRCRSHSVTTLSNCACSVRA